MGSCSSTPVDPLSARRQSASVPLKPVPRRSLSEKNDDAASSAVPLSPPPRSTSVVAPLPSNNPMSPLANASTSSAGSAGSRSTSRRQSALRYTITDIEVDLPRLRTAHNTAMYPASEVVVRRGGALVLRIKTDVVITDIAAVQLVVVMSTGGVEFEARLCTAPPGKADAWGITIGECVGTTVEVSVHIPPQAPVGEYSASIRLRASPPSTSVSASSRTLSNVLVSEQKLPQRVLIFFNPWCERDDVFMADPDELKEYVLAEEGLIWTGSSAKLRSRAWNFGQFNNKSVAAVLKLLSTMSPGRRARPVDIAREMTALVNANDDGGVLLGNWSGDYAGGTNPTEWTGSAPILKQFVDSGQSVAYGQCWVFSGVLTTIMRCLGIPARSVTNFDSAHDCEANGTVDKYLDESGKPVAEKNSDSVWNFHVWNDVWMRRPDLPEGNDGWQAIDGTPQELSGGRFATGPASLAMVRNGVAGDYDVGFVTSEVNADVRTLMQQPDGSFKVMKVDTRQVGRFVSTKAVGKAERMDITSLYKHPEGTALERAAALNASLGARQTVIAKASSFEVKLSASKTAAGSPLTLTFEATLADGVAGPRTLTVNMSAQLRRYTCQAIGQPLLFSSKIVLSADNPKGAAIAVVNEKAYLQALHDQFSVDTTAYAVCEETSEVLFESLQARILMPGVEIRVEPMYPRVGEPARAFVRFTNPLSIPLTKLRIAIEGLALTKLQTFEQESLASKGTVEASFALTPKEAGNKVLVVTLGSSELSDVNDRLELDVASGAQP